MKSKTRYKLWLALVAGVMLCVLWDVVPLESARARLDSFPKKGLGFVGRDIPLTDAESEIYGTSKCVKRLYRVGKQMMVLLIIDGSSNRHAVHDPVFCFRGAGWDITNTQEVGLPGGESKVVSLEKGDKKIQAMYWFSDGSHRHASAPRYWWQATLRRLTFGKFAEEPVLIMVQPHQGERLEWNRLLAQFSPLQSI